MKKFFTAVFLSVFFASGTALLAQDRYEGYLGLPGDNLNLYAVLRLFQDCQTLEEFERRLNDENSNINNLDLNYDNEVDYIKVIDHIDRNVHNIVLQVAVGPRENQDVAVITVQQFRDGQVQIQLTGDEELYGRDYIIEPRMDDSMAGTPNPGYRGNTVEVYRTTPAEIAVWPIVRFIYLPSYHPWYSRWYWGYSPAYWHPWRPYSYHYYYGYHYNWFHVYYGYYRPWKYHRYDGWRDSYYVGMRTWSPNVSYRIKTGVYRTTYAHPEERRAGEDRFARSHPEEMKRINDHAISNDRRSDRDNAGRPGNYPDNRSINTNSRRSDRSDVNRSINNTMPDRSVNDRRSANPGNNMPERSVNTNRPAERTERSVNSTPAVTRPSNPAPNNASQRSMSTTRESGRQEARSAEKTRTNSAPESRRKSETKSESSSSSRKAPNQERRH
jgi:hypothetical protein